MCPECILRATQVIVGAATPAGALIMLMAAATRRPSNPERAVMPNLNEKGLEDGAPENRVTS